MNDMNHVDSVGDGGEVLYRLLSGDVKTVEDDEMRRLLASGQAAIFLAAVELAAVRLFGVTPNAREITRYVTGLRQRLSADKAFRAREVETVIRIVLGERWLSQEIDVRRIRYNESYAMLAMIKDLRLSMQELANFVEQAKAAAAGITNVVAAFSEEIFAQIDQARNR